MNRTELALSIQALQSERTEIRVRIRNLEKKRAEGNKTVDGGFDPPLQFTEEDKAELATLGPFYKKINDHVQYLVGALLQMTNKTTVLKRD